MSAPRKQRVQRFFTDRSGRVRPIRNPSVAGVLGLAVADTLVRETVKDIHDRRIKPLVRKATPRRRTPAPVRKNPGIVGWALIAGGMYVIWNAGEIVGGFKVALYNQGLHAQ